MIAKIGEEVRLGICVSSILTVIVVLLFVPRNYVMGVRLKASHVDLRILLRHSLSQFENPILKRSMTGGEQKSGSINVTQKIDLVWML